MPHEYKRWYRRKLPHLHPPGAVLFVTIRLAGSIPKAVLQKWKREKEWLEREHAKISKKARDTQAIEALNHAQQLAEFQRRWFRNFEDILDRARHGPTWLKDPAIARLVADSLQHRDGEAYRLDAYTIMSITFIQFSNLPLMRIVCGQEPILKVLKAKIRQSASLCTP